MSNYYLLPKDIRQHLFVEVYLPKNLLNYGALIELLTEIIEFNCAHNWLIKNCQEMWNNQDIWKEYSENYKAFEQQIMAMRKTIIGFSIYEVDGAFEYKPHDKQRKISVKKIPCKVFTLTKKDRENFLVALKSNNIGHISLVFKENQQDWDPNVKIKKRDEKHWKIQAGNNTVVYEIADTGTQLDVNRPIWLLEERTLVIRFITDLEIGPEHPIILGDRDSEDGERDKARKRIWDTMVLIGAYFVYNLGSRVGIEDEIWTTYDFGFLWKWKRGK